MDLCALPGDAEMMKTEKKTSSFALLVVCGALGAVVTTACQSKFSESSPQSVSAGTVPLEQRAQQQAEIDRLLNQSQRQVQFVKTLMDKVKAARATGAALS